VVLKQIDASVPRGLAITWCWTTCPHKATKIARGWATRDRCRRKSKTCYLFGHGQ
jgi:hypothetical protein